LASTRVGLEANTEKKKNYVVVYHHENAEQNNLLIVNTMSENVAELKYLPQIKI